MPKVASYKPKDEKLGGSAEAKHIPSAPLPSTPKLKLEEGNSLIKSAPRLLGKRSCTWGSFIEVKEDCQAFLPLG
jgi:hypothetical protein